MKNKTKLQLFKYSTKSLFINLTVFLIVNYFWGFNIAVLVALATICSAIDEFGYINLEREDSEK